VSNDLELFDNAEFDKEMLELEKEWLEIEKYSDFIDQQLMNIELFEDLLELVRGIKTKLKLLSELKHKNIREQYFIDLFLSQAISIYEGFVHNFLFLLNEKSSIIDKLDEIQAIYDNEILYKNSKKDKANDVDKAISILLEKTLNKPLFIKKVFEIIFNYNLDESPLLGNDSKFVTEMNRALKIRNAHIHKNGIHTEDKYSLEDVNQLIEDLIQFMDILVSQLCKKQTEKFAN